MAGKNHTLTSLRVYLDGYDISGDTRSVDSLDGTMGEVDMTAVAETVRNYLADLVFPAAVRGFKALMNDTASSGAYTLLINPETGHEISVLMGQAGAAPDEGDPAYLLGGVQMSDNAMFDSASAVLQTDFLPDAGVVNYNPNGVVLSDATSLGATTSKTAINNGGSSSNGYHTNLHVIATASGNFSLTIEHSTTGAFGGEEATLHTFTANGGSITSEHGSGTGTVRQYVRARLIRTGGSTTPVITFARG
jgi:hypothetical protein